MDNDLMTLWLNALLLDETQVRDLITELQAAREASVLAESDVQTQREKDFETIGEGVDATREVLDTARKAIEAAVDTIHDALENLNETLGGLSESVL